MTCHYSILPRLESGFDDLWSMSPLVSYEGMLALTKTDPMEARDEALSLLGERFKREPKEVRLRIEINTNDKP